MLTPKAQGAIECDRNNVVHGTQERENFVEGQNHLCSGITIGAESGKCSRVSCSNDAAIWLCNNSGEDIDGMDSTIAADYIDHIFDECQRSSMYYIDFASRRQENSEG